MNLGILFKCNEAAHICDKSQYKESSFIERLLMRMHQWMCAVCREHSSENTKLTEIIQKADLKTMPEKDKIELREVIQQEISK
ncbi:MAG: hypothetical protein KJO05_08865 [Bacteroidia bacterium]|nr:hypothetical protein [Bacteroidia bacterium]NNF30623.1 hypothetical protein [Flavobacteriaceae bacterium]MBT8276290.1 hypothetical protein [Bacteroidia bacterium]NNJ80924.1 hypothetical protein [Flavobacteriaceae bacterium]NNK53183.1 hypothetical protein [Flavobacteriaceae bacterium]